MLFDPSVIWEEPLHLLIVLGIILIGKTFAAVALVLLFRYPLNTALTVGASLAQIGEFSFILGGLGVALGVMPAEGQSLILAGALISIAVNPAIFFLIDPFQHWARARSALARRLELRDDPLAQLPMSVDHKYLAGQVVIAGYGRVGERVAAMLAERNVPYVVADQNRELVDALRHKSIPAVSGDVSTPEVLIQAHIARAAVLVIAIHDTVHVRTMVDIARTLNPDIRIVVRTHSPDEAALLKKEQVGAIFLGEEELARGMTESILTDLTPAPGH
jgi:CPA2 family monovalent cation:H+ antiporter-2